MAMPERDSIYTGDGAARTRYTRESNATGWFVGIIVALALLAIGYLVLSANSVPSTGSLNNSPAISNPTADPYTPPMTEAPPAPAETAPLVPAEGTPAAPADATPAAPAQ